MCAQLMGAPAAAYIAARCRPLSKPLPALTFLHLDQFLGMAQILGGQPGMTGYLHVNYHNRTPLNTELKLEGRLVKIEGRKTIMRGEMVADGVMTASCEGLFVQPKGGMQSVKTLDVPRR